VVARSRFWYYLSLLKKIKKANGEIISVREIFEKNANNIKNFGMWLRYDSRSGTHNMYKEYRDTTLTGAVEKMYADLASRHRARKSAVQIIRTAVVKTADCRRANTQQFQSNNIKNYGMWLRYDSRSGTHNMYKEYRDTTLTGAVEKMYADLASRHRARKSAVQIIRTAVVKTADCRRANTQQFQNNEIKFRLMHRVPRPSSKEFRKTFKAQKPCTFF